MANALKDQGNKAFQAKDYDKAIDLFSQAIALDPNNFVLFSNRSAAKAGKRQYSAALVDAEQCIKINPAWSKGYARKGAALHGQRRYDDAVAAYETGLKLEDSPALRKGLQEVKDAKASDERGDGADALGLGKMFGDPNLIGKLAANPRTAKHLVDPGFVEQLRMLQRNPSLAQGALNDPRMIDVLGALMGIDMQGFSREEGSDELPPGYQKAEPEPTPAPKPTSPPPQPAASSSKAREPPKSEDVKMADPEEDDEDAKTRKEAEAEKKLGAEAYKAKKLDEAAVHFQKAWDIWPQDITFLTNLAAAYFEQGEYDKCIEACDKAVDEGRSLRADYKLVAKALGRTGNAYAKKGDLPTAIKFYNKSLTEHRTPDVLAKLREAERTQAEAARLEYIDPEKAAQAREEGNALFHKGDFAGAVKAYTEAIKRAPTDPRGYNNRANAYTKLVALPEALKDTDEAIKVDPTFVKAYVRKSHVLFAMKDFTKAIEAIQRAADVDTEKKHDREIREQMTRCEMEMYNQRAGESEEETLQRAMRDPEIASIMGDPIMQSILQQAQGDPAALQDHMKNPAVRNNIMKLINAGIIKTR
ncbi:activator of Hsp70 and Hsp90 chaperone [Fomitopsis serialis]|uniref:activator of Hsp70 and Hsp90 chaperone n=1 Tax=Fomitopsis serialis TaxID=139415 RepID=UPI002008D8D3|nr:activator of Hsp70 and Hsp90 chaperone [Neoantrodia serialis]KAH9918139.1 activator of Hsp70 and Hsp90 chaperone [Neoantrodia serialis]